MPVALPRICLGQWTRTGIGLEFQQSRWHVHTEARWTGPLYQITMKLVQNKDYELPTSMLRANAILIQTQL